MRSARVERRIKAVDAYLLLLNKRVQEEIRSHLPDRSPLRVLEAGCGSASQIDVDANWHVTGIDLNERQLARNTSLHEKVQGDLETHDWAPESFDLIICWDVLEHLPHPGKALERLFHALSAGGILVLAFPHALSIKGLITKFTPFYMAKVFYRHIIGEKRDFSELNQFPTYLRISIRPERIAGLAREHRLEVVYEHSYEGPVQRYLRALHRLADAGFFCADLLLRALTFGFFQPNHTDCILILRKPADNIQNIGAHDDVAP